MDSLPALFYVFYVVFEETDVFTYEIIPACLFFHSDVRDFLCRKNSFVHLIYTNPNSSQIRELLGSLHRELCPW